MELWSRTTSMLRNLFRKRQVENQLDDEVHAYLNLLTDERIASGMPASEARRTAQAEFGGIEQLKQAVRDRRAGTDVELLWQDARFGLRQLRRNPGFTLTVVLTLALSIGANTAIFSIVNALMLKSLPYAHPEHLGVIYERAAGPHPSQEMIGLDGQQWEALRDNVPSLISAISSGRASGVNLEANSVQSGSSQRVGRVQYLQAARISAHYLDVLGIEPLIGRNFTAVEDQPHGPKSAILSYNLWCTTFGADRNLLGQTIHLKGEQYTVIGVLPQGAVTPSNAEIYTALQPSREGEGGGTNFDVITRLRDGATWQQADAEINRAWAARAARFAEHGAGAQLTWYSVPLQKGQTDNLRPKALTLMLAAGIILLIACANLAGLTLVRILRRTPEIATRLALGASHGQIQKQLWVENLLLALIGGSAGIAAGFVALRGLLSMLPEGFLPVAGVSLDGRVLAFTLTIAIGTCLLFGMLPALASRKVDLRSSIATRAGAGGDRLRLRQALIAGEVALTVVLLAASGLLIRTLIHLETLPPGFNPKGVMTAKASLADARYRDPAAFAHLLDTSIAAMQQIPGVQTAAVGLTLPYERALNDSVKIGNGPEAGVEDATDVVYATPGYFDALQISLLRGRAFTGSDGAHSQPVAIVNKAFARRFFNGADPIGRTFNNGVTIVGMVADVATAPGIDDSGPITSERTVYMAAAQVNERLLPLVHTWFQPSWIVRTAAPIEGLTGLMQRALSSADPSVPFSGFYSMRDLMVASLATQRIEVALLSAMAGLALLLSAVGIFALVSNLVVQKTREIGIRIALGSSVRRAMTHVSSPGVRAAGAGLAVGLILCAGALRTMRSVLYGVGVYDAPTLAAVVLTLAAVTLLATVVPTLRIARIEPAKTLRDE